MARGELLSWISGSVLLAIGGSAIVVGLTLWLWAFLSGNAGAISTVEDVLFHHSVQPQHLHFGIIEAVWRRILNSDLPWFSFGTGVFLACVGAVLVYHAYNQRSARLAASALEAARAIPAPRPDWWDDDQRPSFSRPPEDQPSDQTEAPTIAMPKSQPEKMGPR
jgi:hypothetical protein